MRQPNPSTLAMPASPAGTARRAQAAAPLRIALCGPIGEAGAPAGGGYEAANRRTCDALRRRGVEVVELPYPKAGTRWLLKLARYAVCFVRLAGFLLTQHKRYDALHLTPLNMQFALAETLLVSCARWAGKPVLVDIRAGTFVRHYQSASRLYQRTIDRTLRLATRVSVEGQEYISFVRKRTQHPVSYLPNYVDSLTLRQSPIGRQLGNGQLGNGEKVRLVYFGRVVPEKGIEIALQTLALLRSRGHDARLELIGDGPAGYIDHMKSQYASLPVEWTGSLPLDKIVERVAQAHFFLFASRHDGEGHSNALNEAMALGLVPICSAQGFNRSVVGRAGVVLPVGASPADYAAAIDEVLVSKRWGSLSAQAQARLRRLYTEDRTIPALIESYRRLLSRVPA